LRLPDGRISSLVFARAAQTPFGTVSEPDKVIIGRAIKGYIQDL
jgi:hypothetical protein